MVEHPPTYLCRVYIVDPVAGSSLPDKEDIEGVPKTSQEQNCPDKSIVALLEQKEVNQGHNTSIHASKNIAKIFLMISYMKGLVLKLISPKNH